MASTPPGFTLLKMFARLASARLSRTQPCMPRVSITKSNFLAGSGAALGPQLIMFTLPYTAWSAHFAS